MRPMTRRDALLLVGGIALGCGGDIDEMCRCTPADHRADAAGVVHVFAGGEAWSRCLLVRRDVTTPTDDPPSCPDCQ